MALLALDLEAQTAPNITTQPVSQTNLVGSNVVFSVAVAGTGPFTYQWLFNGIHLPNNVITTVAGGGSGGDGGAAINASLNWPSGICFDSKGNLYVAEQGNDRIRKIDTNGIITTVAGDGPVIPVTGSYFGNGGAATNAGLNGPQSVACDASGNLYIADRFNNVIRMVDVSGIITTVAGNGSQTYAGDGGLAINASLSGPQSLAFDGFGNLYIADSWNNRIRKVAYGYITTVAGNGVTVNGLGTYSGDGGLAANAGLNVPGGVSFDVAGNLYISDVYNSRVRKVDQNGIIATVAGNGNNAFAGDGSLAAGASLYWPFGATMDAAGNLFIADMGNNRVRLVDTNGIIHTMAGNGNTVFAGDGGAATNASLCNDYGVAVDKLGNLFIADAANNRIREVSFIGYPTRSLNIISTNDAGKYSVIVNGANGSVTSSVATLTVVLPASIQVQPPSQWVGNGSNVTLNVTVTGTAPLIYSWFFNSTNLIQTGTNASLTLSNFNDGNIGQYSVIVTNTYGSDASDVATLTIGPPPSILVQPTNQLIFIGNNAVLNVTATGDPQLSYLWYFNTTDLVQSGTNTSLVVSNLNSSNAGDYFVIVTNAYAYASAVSQIATLSLAYPPSVTSQPISQIKFTGSTATFSVGMDGTGPFSYQWHCNGTNPPNSTSAFLTLTNITTNNIGDYSVAIASPYGSVTSAVATLTVVLPSLQVQPPGQWVSAGSNVTLSVTAVSLEPIFYSWFFNATNLLQTGTNATFALTNFSADNSGQYTVGVTNLYAYAGVTSQVATLTLAFPPSITNQPVSQTKLVGSNVTFTVGVMAAGPVNYQWLWNNSNLLKGTNATLTLTNITVNSAGDYSVVITNLYGNITSIVATLTVVLPPTITVQPVSQWALAGSNATLSVAATGTGPLYYSWYFNTTNLIQSGTDWTLTVSNFASSNIGQYKVVVTNAYARATSQIATLGFPLIIVTQPVSQTNAVGSMASLSMVVTGSGPYSYQWQFNGTNLPNNIISTVAGNGTTNYAGDGGLATNAGINSPSGITLDAAGNLYFSDSLNHRIRKVGTNGIIKLVAGNGTKGFSGDSGKATNASLNTPFGVVFDKAGNLYFSDQGNNRIRMVSTNGIITTVVGNGSSSVLYYPLHLAFDTTSNLYIVDNQMCRIRRATTNGIITTVAGTGSYGYSGDNGPATSAKLWLPSGVTLDASGNFYIADMDNNRIRKVATNGIISTVAGNGSFGSSGDWGAATNASLYYPAAVTFDAAGNLLIADYGNARIRRVDTSGFITTIAGNGIGKCAGDGGAATNASLWLPAGLAVDAAGNLLIADSKNNRIRKVLLYAGYPTLSFNSTVTNNAGAYSVVITSPYGSVTSSVVNLSVVIPPPQIIVGDAKFGFSTNHFGFNFSGGIGQTVVIEGSINLVNWTPLFTNISGGNPVYFVDPASTNFALRYYRARTP